MTKDRIEWKEAPSTGDIISGKVFEATIGLKRKNNSDTQALIYCSSSEAIQIFVPLAPNRLNNIYRGLGITPTITCTATLARGTTMGNPELGMNPEMVYLQINSLTPLLGNTRPKEFKMRDLEKFCKRVKNEMGLIVEPAHEYI